MWNIWVDTGGTFTDGLALSPDGSERRVKILTTSALRGTVSRVDDDGALAVDQAWGAPSDLIRGFRFRLLGRDHPERSVVRFDADGGRIELDGPIDDATSGMPFEVVSDEEAPLLAARLLTGTVAGSALPACRMRLATTLGTNALLTRAGVPTALFVTAGFGDLPAIGDQQRPDLFRLHIERPRPLHERIVEVDERIAADGRVLRAPDPEAVREAARELTREGIRSAAVALMHGYLVAEHERLVRDALLEAGFTHVTCSHEVAARIKLVPRSETTVVDAYLAPVVRGYLERVAASTPEGKLLVMTSSGGLLDPASYRPKDSLLSGPAGGVVGAALAGRRAGDARVIGFDMGGTSTDVARFDGDYEYVYEHGVGDARIVAPALAIESVAAGGGSVCWLDGERLRVGPQSAGADPGPACYGAGGPLSVTDVNLLLGRLDPSRFEIPISLEAARSRFGELQRAIETRDTGPVDGDGILEGLRSIADETMADAIRQVSVGRGYDPGDYALVAFGGAGGQHACAVAQRLGIGRVIVPPDAALLSAHGLGHAVVERFAEHQVLQPLDRAEESIASWIDELAEQATNGVCAAGVARDEIAIRRRILNLRFAGQENSLEIEWTPTSSPLDDFEQRYATLYGHRPERRAVELESIRVVASSRAGDVEAAGPGPRSASAPATRRRALFGHTWREVDCHERERLPAGAELAGPALVFERHSTTVVEPGWTLRVDTQGALILERNADSDESLDGARPEAIRLELFTQRFYGLVREMGRRLERTAISTNVKERLDFSCALLDAAGELVVNAPHIPVHLGALGMCVRRLRETLALRPGDVVVTNHPAYGGSHLPDVTVVTPVFAANDGDQPIGFVASRAHHAEIGGARPGSMPPSATHLLEEGVVIPPFHLVRDGEAQWDEMRAMLEAPPWPTRNVADNLADLRAAVAANHAGATALRALAARHGADVISRYMTRLTEVAERRIRAALEAIDDGEYAARESLDDGSTLAVRITIRGDGANIDFDGTSETHPGNLNATPAIVQSAVLYVLRLLIDRPLPLNEGLLRAVTIELPRCMLNPEFDLDPAEAPAVVGGNVETSQRLVDTLIKALGLAACSQGTMNNVIFGNAGYGYYETLGGGTGAGPGFAGAHAVHSHMTNTRITDPELIEQRFPVRVERFARRRGSGGAGRFAGGDGLVRELRFLEPASLSVLTQHRSVAPYGLAGGGEGRTGRQRVERADGTTVELDSIDGCEVEPGDRLIVETPGGGGFGEP
ncbi:MAG: 5-oxoprolinase [bacterium]|nr:5-oxoprolinase [bacterium]